MFAKARQLKADSEARRKKLAEELEAKRFRLGSDVLRARASAITAERTALDRLSQLQEKQRLAELEAERERHESTFVDATTAKMFDRAAVESEARRRLAIEMREALGAQVAVKKVLGQETRRHDIEEDGKYLDYDRAGADKLRQADIDRRRAAREEYERVSAYNARELAMKKSSEAADYVRDMADLHTTLESEAAAIAREKGLVEARKKDTLEFRKKLEDQMAIQAEDKGWMDKYYTEEANKAWEKREVTWRAEADARSALMGEVAGT